MFKAPPLFYIATCYRFYRQLPVPRFQQRQKQLHQLWRENPRRHPENFLQSRVCSTRPGVQSRRAVHVRQSIIFLIANYVFFLDKLSTKYLFNIYIQYHILSICMD